MRNDHERSLNLRQVLSTDEDPLYMTDCIMRLDRRVPREMNSSQPTRTKTLRNVPLNPYCQPPRVSDDPSHMGVRRNSVNLSLRTQSI